MSADVRMLSLWQPWASLIAVGAKRIETRSWSTSYRGPLAIHAALRPVREKVTLGDWEAWPPDPRGKIHPNHETERPPRIYNNAAHVWRGFNLGSWYPLPLGAVVAVCDLVDVLPIYRFLGTRDGATEPPGATVPCVGTNCDDSNLNVWRGQGRHYQAPDQLPFGDFAPGRFAWLLDNVRALPAPIPCRGHQGLRACPVPLPEEVLS